MASDTTVSVIENALQHEQLEAELQCVLLEIFKLALVTPAHVAEIFVHSLGSNGLTVVSYLGGQRPGSKPDLYFTVTRGPLFESLRDARGALEHLHSYLRTAAQLSRPLSQPGRVSPLDQVFGGGK